MSNRWVAFGLTLGALGTAAVVAPRQAEAQMDTGRTIASPQGLIGGGLLGAEVVMMVEGAAGVRNPWIQLGTGALGLAAGCVGGFFVDQAIDGGNDRTLPAVSTAMLVVGLGLIIPTAIVFVSSTMYRPEDNHANSGDDAGDAGHLDESVGDTGGTATPPASTGGGGGGSRGRHRGHGRPRVIGPEALLNLSPGQFRIGLPAVSIGSSYTMAEMRQFDLAPQTEWRIPLVTAAF